MEAADVVVFMDSFGHARESHEDALRYSLRQFPALMRGHEGVNVAICYQPGAQIRSFAVAFHLVHNALKLHSVVSV